MAKGINKAIIVGRLGGDPEMRVTQSGTQVCTLSVATSESWKDKSTGERKEKTEWISVDIFQEGLIGVCEKYLRKGSKVYIEGKFATRKYQDQNGNDRYSTSVVVQGFDGKMIMLDGKQEGQSGGNDNQQGGYGSGGNGMDDDIPFMASVL